MGEDDNVEQVQVRDQVPLEPMLAVVVQPRDTLAVEAEQRRKVLAIDTHVVVVQVLHLGTDTAVAVEAEAYKTLAALLLPLHDASRVGLVHPNELERPEHRSRNSHMDSTRLAQVVEVDSCCTLPRRLVDL